MIHATLPHLSPERINQMIHLATSYTQDAKHLPWYQSVTLKSRRLFYGLSASAVTASCIAAFWLAPALQSAPAPSTQSSEASVSEYILQDFLDDMNS